MNKFHYYYTFPTSITVTTVFSFMIKGEWFLPFLVFTMMSWWGYLMANLIFYSLYRLVKLTGLFNSVEKRLMGYLEHKEAIKIDASGKFEKGRYFKGFKKIVKQFYYVEFNAEELIKILNALICGILMTLLMIQTSAPKFFLHLIIYYYIFFFCIYCCLYSIIDKQSFVEDIIEGIEKQPPQTTNPTP